jgi:hypothetical protein
MLAFVSAFCRMYTLYGPQFKPRKEGNSDLGGDKNEGNVYTIQIENIDRVRLGCVYEVFVLISF